MLGWMSPWLCEGTSVQQAGAGLSRAQAVSAYSPLVFSCSWDGAVSVTGGCLGLAPLRCVFAVDLPSLFLRSCVPGTTWVLSSVLRPSPLHSESLSSLSSLLSLDASHHRCLCFICRL